jgi:hypothetical protein
MTMKKIIIFLGIFILGTYLCLDKQEYTGTWYLSGGTCMGKDDFLFLGEYPQKKFYIGDTIIIRDSTRCVLISDWDWSNAGCLVLETLDQECRYYYRPKGGYPH